MWKIIRKLLLGLALRCPNCEKGRTFYSFFKVEDKCAHCDVRFERHQGESMGAVFISLTMAELLSIGGFFVFEWLFRPSMAFQLIFWGLFLVLFSVFAYRHMRGLWIAISYLTGGVYLDSPNIAPADVIVTEPKESSDRLQG